MADDLKFQLSHKEEINGDTAPGAEAKEDAKMRRRKKVLLLGLAGVLAKIAIGAGAYYGLVGGHYVATDNAYVDASTAQINAQVAGQILDVRVDDTQFVHKGDILAVIDPEDATLKVQQAEADYRRTLQRVGQYYAQESGAFAQVKAREADLSRAKLDYSRRLALSKSGAVSQEELSTTRAAYDSARANLIAAKESAEAQSVLTRGAKVENHPETASARAALETAKLSLRRTIIRAPIDGVVTQRNAQVGQRIEIGQSLMIVAPLQQAYVDANFKEGQLADVRIGQSVELKSDLYGDKVKYHGTVAGLGGGTGSAFAVIPAQNATGNWIKVVQRVPVRITLDQRELKAHPLRVGLSMEARIDTREQKKS